MKTDDESHALVRTSADELVLRPTPIDALIERKEHLDEAVRKLMKEGSDFGTIPGCGPKRTLLKPGAEKACAAFGLAPKFEIDRRDLADGHREYVIVSEVVSIASGVAVGQGVGSCSTMESRYRFRRGVENPNIADTYNTVLKIAKKRALVDAVLTTLGMSDLFTQDLEDIGPDDNDRATPAPARRETKRSTPPEAKAEPHESWVIDMIGKLDEAETVDELKRLAPVINQMTPSGSASRKACRRAFDESMARLTKGEPSS